MWFELCKLLTYVYEGDLSARSEARSAAAFVLSKTADLPKEMIRLSHLPHHKWANNNPLLRSCKLLFEKLRRNAIAQGTYTIVSIAFVGPKSSQQPNDPNNDCLPVSTMLVVLVKEWTKVVGKEEVGQRPENGEQTRLKYSKNAGQSY